MQKILKVFVTVVYIFMFALNSSFFYVNASNNETIDDVMEGYVKTIGYSEYLLKTGSAPHPDSEININAKDYTFASEQAQVTVGEILDIKDCLLLNGIGGKVYWTVEVELAGYYELSFDYCPLPYKGTNIVLKLEIDKKTPFDQATRLILNRIWKDNGKIKTDKKGNQIVPPQIEVPQWTIEKAKDTDGYQNEPFLFYFGAGKHEISLETTSEPIAINKIILNNSKSF